MGLFDTFKNKVEEKSEEVNPIFSALVEANLGVEDVQVVNNQGIVTVTGRTDHGNVIRKVNEFIAGQPGVQEVINQVELMDIRHQGVKMMVATKGSNLNVRAGDGTDHDIVGRFPRGTEVTVVKRYNDTWFVVEGKGLEGEPVEGYCHTDYLVDA